MNATTLDDKRTLYRKMHLDMLEEITDISQVCEVEE
jgi:hypothetical protein